MALLPFATIKTQTPIVQSRQRGHFGFRPRPGKSRSPSYSAGRESARRFLSRERRHAQRRGRFREQEKKICGGRNQHAGTMTKASEEKRRLGSEATD
ncbi:hypothetical protein DICSQDRAFT_154434 [Dichomitus squalens LYAD-421 SS1]|uniref:Uncharacterized protein n=1 Tax=Dichomitus squalens TaxID=114155 RepID=A0A4Q9MRZ1_9APHY|nr:uncharacterized protein DICSQDRAFT_154434 [Dichomitus squalens LYAD-421 SS1]EJF62591.1 hypothetical protein DICSQDRAFT_154434 [Dichomitus squalens LYAD-421 SS1]TBU29041.1 hypothetical protein BD311DRAFT_693628 [Dichomitus squalens]